MRKSGCVVVLSALVLSLGMTTPKPASGSGSGGPERVRRYHLHDVGTLGGTFTTLYDFDLVNFTPAPFNDRGQLAVTSLTGAGFASGGEWTRGGLRPLQNFPNANAGGGGSNANGINAEGVIVGAADDGVINPRNNAPYDHGVRWDAAGIHRLPELNGNASWANFIADDGTIVGYANNAIPDAFTYAGTQTRATLWHGGVVRDLGTLGGTDSAAFKISACDARDQRPGARRRVVIGTSALDTPPGAPFGLPATAAFAWSDGAMRDLGNLGGGFSTPSDVNCQGQVTVISFDASNRHFQSFLWTDGRRVVLNAMGGHFVEAVALNDATRIVGAVSDPTDHALAAIWTASGEVRTLGTVGTDAGSIALGVNRHGVTVGGSGAVDFHSAAAYAHAFVADGVGVVDLNTLIPAGSALTLNVAYSVNDRGEIAGLGTNAAGETHAFVLTPDTSSDAERLPPASQSPAAPNSVIRMESRRGIERGLGFSRLRHGVR